MFITLGLNLELNIYVPEASRANRGERVGEISEVEVEEIQREKWREIERK